MIKKIACICKVQERNTNRNQRSVLGLSQMLSSEHLLQKSSTTSWSQDVTAVSQFDVSNQPSCQVIFAAGCVCTTRWHCCLWHTPYLCMFCLPGGGGGEEGKDKSQFTHTRCPALNREESTMSLHLQIVSHLSEAFSRAQYPPQSLEDGWTANTSSGWFTRWTKGMECASWTNRNIKERIKFKREHWKLFQREAGQEAMPSLWAVGGSWRMRLAEGEKSRGAQPQSLGPETGWPEVAASRDASRLRGQGGRGAVMLHSPGATGKTQYMKHRVAARFSPQLWPWLWTLCLTLCGFCAKAKWKRDRIMGPEEWVRGQTPNR